MKKISQAHAQKLYNLTLYIAYPVAQWSEDGWDVFDAYTTSNTISLDVDKSNNILYDKQYLRQLLIDHKHLPKNSYALFNTNYLANNFCIIEVYNSDGKPIMMLSTFDEPPILWPPHHNPMNKIR